MHGPLNVKYNLKVVQPRCVSNIIRNNINYVPSKHNFILQDEEHLHFSAS